jgi:hypothetical protein
MIRLAKLFVIAAMLASGITQATRADLITSVAGINGPVSVIDFEEFSGIGYNFAFGPVALSPSVIFNANPSGGGNTGFGSVLGEGNYVLGDNGVWNGTNSYSGLDSDQGYMEYSFLSPISGVGGFINYVPDNGPVWIQVLGSNGNVLEQYDLTTSAPIDTPNGINSGAFRGIQRATVDVWAFRVVNSYIALDDLSYTSSGKTVMDLPEPSSLSFFVVSGLGLFIAKLRSRKLS